VNAIKKYRLSKDFIEALTCHEWMKIKDHNALVRKMLKGENSVKLYARHHPRKIKIDKDGELWGL
jgi:hypothetical protein